ncbi:MAG: DoxX family protein [Chloroflexia bacterium]
MDTALWVVQVLLALAFLAAGLPKVVQPREKLVPRMSFVEDFSQNHVRAIGILEILAAIGLILPRLTGILPWLTPLAAVGLVLTMIGAARTNLRRHENQKIIANVVLGLLAVFVIFGRL